MDKVMRRASLFLVCICLAACGGNVRGNLGLKKEAPDEFMVISNPPLSVPPDFSLRPPQAKNAAKPGRDVSKKARTTLFKSDAEKPADDVDTVGESTLLEKTGEADPNIREILHQENTVVEEKKQEKGFFDRLFGDDEKVVEDKVVDPSSEKERILKNQKEGKPVTEGDVPEYEEEGFLQRLLN